MMICRSISTSQNRQAYPTYHDFKNYLFWICPHFGRIHRIVRCLHSAPGNCRYIIAVRCRAVAHLLCIAHGNIIRRHEHIKTPSKHFKAK